MEGFLLSRSTNPNRTAFTLVELLVTIGIIAVLISILLPVIGRIRIAGQKADTQNFLNQLVTAIDRYQQDFRAYPGPFGNNDIYYKNFSGGVFTKIQNTTPTGSGYDNSTQVDPTRITMEENLVLGLLGGVHPDQATKSQLDYDATTVGAGPASLQVDPVSGLPTIPRRYPAYIDNTNQLSWSVGQYGKYGHYNDDSGAADDTIIPCFVDRFSSPMPFLYLRAKVGANPNTTSDSVNPIITDDVAESATTVRAGQYDLSQIQPYTGSFTGTWPSLTLSTGSPVGGGVSTGTPPTGSSIGVGKTYPSPPNTYTVAPANGNLYHGLAMMKWTGTGPSLSSQFPYDAYPYFTGPGGYARQKDTYILISAGADRIYGTADDICSFGEIGH